MQLSKCYDRFLRLSGLLDLFGKGFLTTFKSSNLLSWKSNAKKKNSLISFFTMQKKKLALILFHCLGQETWLDDLWKHFSISQSRFYNSMWENSKMFINNFELAFSIISCKLSRAYSQRFSYMLFKFVL